LPDFSPASQDAAAIEYLKDLGALRLIKAGDFNGALQKAGRAWASLPTSTSGQPNRKASELIAIYQRNGGSYV
jgi:lysozyme